MYTCNAFLRGALDPIFGVATFTFANFGLTSLYKQCRGALIKNNPLDDRAVYRPLCRKVSELFLYSLFASNHHQQLVPCAVNMWPDMT